LPQRSGWPGAITQASAGQVQLAQARGTLWNGSAQLVLTGGAASQDRAALPGRIAWQLRPTLERPARPTARRLLHRQRRCNCKWHLRWDGARITLADSQSQWPAAVLAGLGTPWNTLQPQGQLVLRTTGPFKPTGPQGAWC
jgi:general secretion pathway protein N